MVNEEVLKKGNIDWTIIKEDGRIEIELNGGSWFSYPSDVFDLEEAYLHLARQILHKFQLYSYEIKKKERHKGVITFLGDPDEEWEHKKLESIFKNKSIVIPYKVLVDNPKY